MKKIKELTNKEMNLICKNHLTKNCKDCPLLRIVNGKQLHCYKWSRAYYYFNVEWFKNNWTDKEELQKKLEELKEEKERLEDVEINL